MRETNELAKHRFAPKLMKSGLGIRKHDEYSN